MARFILIDRWTGYIWGDSADFAAGQQSGLTPAEAANLLHQSIGDGPVKFEETSRHDNGAIYDVYQAAINGSEAVPVVYDGQDQETIEAVVRDCDFVTSLIRAGEND